MGSRKNLIFLVICLLQVFVTRSDTYSADLAVLNALKNTWQNVPPNWSGNDPCGDHWDGISCTSNRITSITLASMNIKGQLSGDITDLPELQLLDLSYNTDLEGNIPSSIGNLKKLTNLILVHCSLTGPIPDAIGSLKQLQYLSLNDNNFNGEIPSSISNLINLSWLDLGNNSLEGTIPVSPGLDTLVNARHFHFGYNKLSGKIPPMLFSSSMQLLHVLFDGNKFTGEIPSSLGLVQSLEILRLDGNQLSGPVPSNLNNLTSVSGLYLSNNDLTGASPNLTGMYSLQYVDLSNNSFESSVAPPWFTTLQSLTTLMMEKTHLKGELPDELFALPNLQSVTLKNNMFNGTLDFGTSYSSHLQLVDLQQNSIDRFIERGTTDVTIILVNNPVCDQSGSGKSYCAVSSPNNSYTTPANNCVQPSCRSSQISSPNCVCSHPYKGTLVFRAPLFSDLGNATHYVELQSAMLKSFRSSNLPVDSVSLSNLKKNKNEYLELTVDIFPSGQNHFNHTAISQIGLTFSGQTFKPPSGYGPYYFLADQYLYFSDESAGKSKTVVVIIGVAIGGCVFLLLLVLAGIYALRQKKRAQVARDKCNPFARWESQKGSGSIPQIQGPCNFSFEELKKYTNHFSEANEIGSGGYGKVYRGSLPSGQLIAVKRAQQESMQGALEFKTELELLSRVHHKNVVSLVGYCFQRDEQMLVYEFIPNGSVKDGLSGKIGVRLDWTRRLKVALGTARGLAYLHELANPPIIHRDIKSNNILLDEKLTAKVADFGLSKHLGDKDKGQVTHVTTQVKGTIGYLDPEYYMTQQLTEKSDVYSYGVLMLEMLTARPPIERGKYIVREFKVAIDKSKDLYSLQALIDPVIGATTLKGFDKYVDVAMKCVEESGNNRPRMGEVVKEIENIMQQAGLNPNAESASTSTSYTDVSKGSENPYGKEAFEYSGKEAFEYSGAIPNTKVEPH